MLLPRNQSPNGYPQIDNILVQLSHGLRNSFARKVFTHLIFLKRKVFETKCRKLTIHNRDKTLSYLCPFSRETFPLFPIVRYRNEYLLAKTQCHTRIVLLFFLLFFVAGGREGSFLPKQNGISVFPFRNRN